MKVRIFLISVLSFFVFLFISCATTVNVNLIRPAELDLNGARTIAVLPIKPSNYYKEVKTTVGMGIVINTFFQVFDVRDYDEEMTIDAIRTQIERGLLDSPYIKLVSSEAVETARRKGYLNPADVYLTGEMVYFDVTDRKKDEKKLVKPARDDEKAEYEIVRYWTRQVSFKLRYQIVDSSTDKVISFNEYYGGDTSSRYESQKDLPSAYSIISYDVRRASRQILKQLQPYTVTKSITLLEAKTKDKELKKRMKAADELADKSQLKDACKAFNDIYRETGLVEAGYNAAVLLEAMGELSLAEELMVYVYEKNPDKRVAKGLADIRYEISQANRLDKQINSSGGSGTLDDDDEFNDLDDFDF